MPMYTLLDGWPTRRSVFSFPRQGNQKGKDNVGQCINVTFEACSCNHCCRATTIIIYSECVYVALCIQYVK